MADDAFIRLAFLLASLCFDQVVSEYCYESRYSVLHNRYETRKIHCSFGCCGPAYDEYCCVSNAGIIVGIVFAAIFGIAVVASMACCFLKHKNNRGRATRPVTTVGHHGTHAHNNVFILPSGPAPPAYSSSSTVTYTSNSSYPGYPAPVGVLPPAYSQPGHPMPPAYGPSTVPPPAYAYDPAYPPASGSAPGGSYPPQQFPPPYPQTQGKSS